jgi:1-acyl-sn-glycerol-3-phosphate acyltransferase
MYEIMRLSGQEYVDKYASVAKEEQKKADKATTLGSPGAPESQPGPDAKAS